MSKDEGLGEKPSTRGRVAGRKQFWPVANLFGGSRKGQAAPVEDQRARGDIKRQVGVLLGQHDGGVGGGDGPQPLEGIGITVVGLLSELTKRDLTGRCCGSTS